LLHLAHFHDVRQRGVIDARGTSSRLHPAVQCAAVRGPAARHGQHEVLATARISHQPQHGALALADQLKQLEAAEMAHGLGP
jgi:hypothetical protein